MAGWHHRLDGREFEWTPGDGDGQGGLACCDSWGRKESDTTERLNWTYIFQCYSFKSPHPQIGFIFLRTLVYFLSLLYFSISYSFSNLSIISVIFVMVISVNWSFLSLFPEFLYLAYFFYQITFRGTWRCVLH